MVQLIVRMLDLLRPVFQTVLTTTLYVTVLIGFIFLAKWLLRDRLNVRWHYVLWLLVMVRLIFPWTPESSFSLYNFADLKVERSQPAIQTESTMNTPVVVTPQTNGTIHDELQPITSQTAGTEVGVEIHTQEVKQTATPVTIFHLIMLIWICGMLFCFIAIMNSHRTFIRKNRASAEITDHRILHLFKQANEKLKIRRKIRLVVAKYLHSPTLYGVFRPRIYMPSHVLQAFENHELTAILLHELSHYKRRDIFINWVMSLALCLHWFNPVLWYAYYRMRGDQEMACDAKALSCMEAEDAHTYAHTILKMLENHNRILPTPGAANFAGGKSQLKKRIRMITLFNAVTYRRSFLGIILVLFLVMVACTGAKEPHEGAAKNHLINTLKVGDVFEFHGYAWLEHIDVIAEHEGIDKDESYDAERQTMIVQKPITFDELDFTVDTLVFYFYDEQLVSGQYVATFETEEAYLAMANKLEAELSENLNELSLLKSLQNFNPSTNGSVQWWAEDESRISLNAFVTNEPTYTITLQVHSPRGTLIRHENVTYGISLLHPNSWQQTGEGDRYKFEGKEGYFQLGAAKGNSLEEVVNREINHHLQPYGNDPQVEEITVGGRDARLILPSEDQPSEMEKQASIVVQYPTPVTINNTTYECLIIYAHADSIRQIGRSVSFITD